MTAHKFTERYCLIIMDADGLPIVGPGIDYTKVKCEFQFGHFRLHFHVTVKLRLDFPVIPTATLLSEAYG